MKFSQSLVALAAFSAGVSAEDECYDYVSSVRAPGRVSVLLTSQ
jgi:hypothetical protein